MNDNVAGRFSAVDSFLVRPDNQFGIIGELIEGEVSPGLFIAISLNSTTKLAAQIDEVKEIEISSGGGKFTLLLVNDWEEGACEFLAAMNVGLEEIDILKTGET